MEQATAKKNVAHPNLLLEDKPKMKIIKQNEKRHESQTKMLCKEIAG